ncbi:MAG: NRDE family protein [Gammaproteobacteria bacterium]|nr:NRDE family protein [Gammaproteobacteria bacterium]
MCCLFLALGGHPQLPLVVAANRDEFYGRATEPARFWVDDGQILAGRDIEQGGTWLGLTRSGRFAAVTNFREPGRAKPDAPSRGHLVRDFLQGQDAPDQYIADLAQIGANYNGFSIVVGTVGQLMYYSNRGEDPIQLDSGIYGLSNHLLDTTWPKIRRGKDKLKRLLATPAGPSASDLLNLLQDRTVADDKELPQSGLELQQERVLSPIFVAAESYGTRCSTAIRLSYDGSLDFTERTFPSHSVVPTTVRYDVELASPAGEPAHQVR